MVTHKMTRKGFTLVELIVVITILAILGTIAFLSFQGYSASARDSKRTSDVRSIVSTLTTKQTEGIGYVSLVTSDPNKRVTSISIAGGATVTAGTNYEAGKPNYVALGISDANFKDPTNVDYKVGATTLVGGAFQVAAKLENDNTPKSLVQGTYNPRKTGSKPVTAITTTKAVVSGDTTVSLADADVGLLKKGDVVTLSVAPTANSVKSISGDGKTITLTTAFTAGGTPTIALTAAETNGLIAGSTTTVANVVVDQDTTTAALPY